MLERSATAQLDENSRAYLEYVIAAAKRMSDLIQDLLTYSRITNEQDRSSETVDLNEVLARVLDGLHASISESGAAIVSDRLPVLRGDRAQFQQVFQNLLSNSLKYRRAEVPLEVEVGCEPSGLDWRLWVRDNGQGFAKEYGEQVFGIFKRLHGRHIPGTGIGLAIVKTIVERHGGQVWAESSEGQGATFFVLLPREESL
jgi:signal transduction histidine kinase